LAGVAVERGHAVFSDNAAAAHPKVIEAIERSNRLDTAYDGDEWSSRLDGAFSDLFETEVRALWVTTGTAANCLALAAMCPPYRAIVCHRDAHIENDEAGAPGFFTGGAKLMLLDGEGAKITPQAVASACDRIRKDVHQVQPAAISITNATEYGLAYRSSEVGALGELARERGLGLHMDGARFANAIVFTGDSPADVTWRAGVDALSFGFVKNGGLNAEALILFRTELADEIRFAASVPGICCRRGGCSQRRSWRCSRMTCGSKMHALRTQQHRRSPSRAPAAGLSGRSQRDFPEGVRRRSVRAAQRRASTFTTGGPEKSGWSLAGTSRRAGRDARSSDRACERTADRPFGRHPVHHLHRIWGSTWIVIKDQLGDVPPQWSVAYRFVIAAAAMVTALYGKGESLKLPRGMLLAAAFLGVAQFAINFNAVYLAEQHITSGVVATFFALLVIPSTLLAWAFLGHRPSSRFLWSSLVAIAGIALLFTHEFRHNPAQSGELLVGLGFTLAGMIGAAAANVFQARPKVRLFPLFSLLAWSMTIGAMVNITFAVVIAGAPTIELRAGYWLGVVYLAIPASVLTFSLYTIPWFAK
jgi:drug/metabolite transporter (DMT)-like permease